MNFEKVEKILSKSFLIAVMLGTSFYINAEQISLDYKNYDEALRGQNTIKFDMESTKAGIITTGFSGVVKKGTLDYLKKDNNYTDVKLLIPVKEIDTDVSGRNEKMWDLCFSADKFSNIEVTFSRIALADNKATGTINVRGESYPVSISYSVENKDGKQKFQFKTTLSIKDLKIPDPSIFIAKVRDEIELSGEFIIE